MWWCCYCCDGVAPAVMWLLALFPEDEHTGSGAPLFSAEEDDEDEGAGVGALSLFFSSLTLSLCCFPSTWVCHSSADLTDALHSAQLSWPTLLYLAYGDSTRFSRSVDRFFSLINRRKSSWFTTFFPFCNEAIFADSSRENDVILGRRSVWSSTFRRRYKPSIICVQMQTLYIQNVSVCMSFIKTCHICLKVYKMFK